MRSMRKSKQHMPTISRFLYSIAIYCLLPLALLRLLWRARRQPAYLRHLGERFGLYHQPPLRQPLIWLHAVSVGETRAAAPLIALLRQRHPDHRILLTHTTPTGRAASEQLFGDDVLRYYLPYDLPGAVARFLEHFRPQAGLLMETELWFNLIATCSRESVPLLLVNARLSARSARGYARIGRLARQGLQALAAVTAQTEADAARLRILGAHNVSVVGNLKFDVTPTPAVHEVGTELRSLFNAARPVFLAASTRDGEEVIVLDAVRLAAVPGLLTVIVPRHPQRFCEVAALLEKQGTPFRRRSEHVAVEADCPLVLGDSMGEMFAYYAACDVAFIGGSLLPYGGQNLIEACAMGKPVIIGKHTYNFEQSAELAVAAGAALRVEDAEALAKTLRLLYADGALRHKMGAAALAFSADHRGAAERTVDQIAVFIEPVG